MQHNLLPVARVFRQKSAEIGPVNPPKTPVSWPFFSKRLFFWGERGAKSLISLKMAKKICLFLSLFRPKNGKKRQNFLFYPLFCLFLSLFEALFERGVNGLYIRLGESEYEQKYPRRLKTNG